MAAEGGYDQVAWTTGEQQADRYNLRNWIDTIKWNSATGYLIATNKGDVIVNKRDVTEENLADHIGKEAAKNSLKVWAGRALLARKLSPAGLVSSVALGAAVEVGKIGAGKFSDVVDKKLQKEFEERTNTQSKTLVLLFIRDMAMGVFPLVVLAIVPWLLG